VTFWAVDSPLLFSRAILVWQLQRAWEEPGRKQSGMRALPFSQGRSKWYPATSACEGLLTSYG